MAAAKRSGTAPLPVNAALRSTLAENFRSARIASGLTQKQLGELAQVSRDYVGQIENATANVSIDILANLAKFLNVSPASLLTPHRVSPP
jgi:transcriptional regulator with XRE-family HTH domain